MVANSTPSPKTPSTRGKRTIEGCTKITIETPATSGNLIEDNRRKQLHAAKTEIWQWLENNPDKTLSVLSMMKTDLVVDSAMASGKHATDDPYFHRTYMTFQRLPKYWIRFYLLENHGHVFTQEALDKMENADPHSTRYVFYIMHGINDSTIWPSELKAKVLLAKWFAQRYTKRGSRMSPTFVGKLFGTNMTLNPVGVYELVVQKIKANLETSDERRINIKHISGEEAN